MTKACTMLVASLAFSSLPVLATGSEEDAHTDAPCPRKTPRDFAPGTVTKIKDKKPPCRFLFRETGVRLEAVADGSRPDPGSNRRGGLRWPLLLHERARISVGHQRVGPAR